jgi:BCCT family betaine/carnitine transporter
MFQKEKTYKSPVKDQKIIKAFGMEMHNPVFVISALLILIFSIITLVFPSASNSALNGAQLWTLSKFDWFYSLIPVLILTLCVVLAVSPFGKIKLGGKDAKPEYKVGSWIAMLFAAGVGIGFMFYGSAEPLGYYTDWFGTPFNVSAETVDARRLAFTTSVFHWGLSAWSIYAIVGLTLAFFAYNMDLPLTIRSAFFPIFGEKIWGWRGHIIDMFAVVSTIFGLACTIGIGATQATGGLSYIFDVEATKSLQIILIFTITIIAIFSILRGMNGGVKLLSNVNMVFAGLLLFFVIMAGPTVGIFESMFETFIYSVPDSLRLTNWVGRADKNFFHDWTIFYWAWWIAWSPFVGMFIAKISKGRTIRQFMMGVLIAPFSIGLVWFTAFGETAISQFEDKVGDLSEGMTDSSLTLFQMLNSLPYSDVTSVVAIFLLIIFIVTSADSGSLVVDSLTSGTQKDTPVRQRVFWAILIGLTSIALLYGGGEEALKSLQAGTVTAALPFSFIVLLYGFCLIKGLLSYTKKNND